MSGRLLTDAAMRAVWNAETVRLNVEGSSDPIDVTGKYLEAQCAHTERRERTELAEWLDGYCDNIHGHVGKMPRRNCPRCWGELILAIRKGKAPTESGEWPEGE